MGALVRFHRCALCARARAGRAGPPMPARASLTTRMALVSAASVAGMLVGAAGVLLLAMLLGLGGELTVLCMLAAEMAAGALAGRHADRHMDAWLEARARAVVARRLPRARVVRPGRVRRPGRRALRRLTSG